MIHTIHKAKYVLTDPDALLDDAGVGVLEDGRISGIIPFESISGYPESAVAEWGSAVIMPGLVNCHAHLELTSLYNRLPRKGAFTEWLSRLIHLRRSMEDAELQSSINDGISRSLASGTTMIGDISSTGIVRSTARNRTIRKTVFEERIALSPGRAAAVIADIVHILDAAEQDDLYYPGLSPHAPYTVSGELYRGLADLARKRKIPLATHIAETEAEIEFLQSGSGEFRDFLKAVNALPPDWNPPGLPPIPYLDSLGVLGPGCLLVHCNYMDPDSIRLVADSGSSIVYCPRSHSFFGHRKHPVRQLLDAGINVALGTDSLASNTSLSLLDEMRFVYKNRKDLTPGEILRAATVNGAKALNADSCTGLLKPGYRADMTVVEVPSDTVKPNASTKILENSGQCIGTIIGGKTAWMKAGIL